MSIMVETCGVFASALFVGIAIMLYLGKSDEKLRNRDAVTKSFIFSHLTASLEGVVSIRAFESEARFIELYKEKIDQNNKYLYGLSTIFI